MWWEDHSGDLVFPWECFPAAFFQYGCAHVESLQQCDVACCYHLLCACLMCCLRFHLIQYSSLCRFDAIENGLMLAQSWLKRMLHGKFLTLGSPQKRPRKPHFGPEIRDLLGSVAWVPLFVPIGEALNPGPHSYLHVNVINPTSLYGKVSDVLSLGDGVHCLSETSVTPKAAHLIRRNAGNFIILYNFLRWPVLKGTINRGSNTGCAVMSNLHVHRAFNQVDANVWSSGRILDVLVPVNCHLTFRFLVVYLPAKSKDNPMRLQEANCIMNEVHKRIVMSDFPTLLVGDFNIEAELLETCNILFDHGWKDLAELSQLKWGFGAEATCRGATRRTFALGDAKVTRFLHDVSVVETYQFDSHPVLKVRLNVAIAKYSQLV